MSYINLKIIHFRKNVYILHNMESNKPYKFLKKGSGNLVSNNHGKTEYAEKRKQKIIDEQKERESRYYKEQFYEKKD